VLIGIVRGGLSHSSASAAYSPVLSRAVATIPINETTTEAPTSVIRMRVTAIEEPSVGSDYPDTARRWFRGDLPANRTCAGSCTARSPHLYPLWLQCVVLQLKRITPIASGIFQR
jgi:hypothetical protein